MVAATPPDRAANFESDDLRARAGSFGDEWVRTRLRRGEFFTPDQTERASFQPLLLGLPLASIEAVNPPAVEPFDIGTTRLDALFLGVRNFVAGVPVDGCLDDHLSSRRRRVIRQMSEQAKTLEGADQDARELSFERYAFLERFDSYMREHRDVIRTHPHFDPLVREVQDALIPLAKFKRIPTAFAPEDEQALDLLV